LKEAENNRQIKLLEYTVTEENRLALCDAIAETVEGFCAEYISDSKELLRYRLSVEDCLLEWLTEDAVGNTLRLSFGKAALRAPFVDISIDGKPKNPYSENDELGALGGSMLRSLGLIPEYSYKNGRNSITFSIKKHDDFSLKKLFLVLLCSAAVGWLGVLLVPHGTLQGIQQNLISPAYNAFFGLLSCIAGPMIFLSVAWGVYGIGDASTLSYVGKKMMSTFIGNDFLVAALGMGLVVFFKLDFSGAQSMASFSGILEMLFGFFPKNVFSPFIDGNTMQIIFLALAVGVGLIFLRKQTNSVARAIEQINHLLQFFMHCIVKLVPYFVALVIISLFWMDDAGVIVSGWKMLAVLLGAIAAACLGFHIYTSLRRGVPLRLLMKKCFPSFLIALTTASSAACFATNIEISEKRLGINNSVTCFGIPLAMVMNNPISVLNNLVMIMFFAWSYQLQCSVLWLVTAALLCGILAIATPPIPGGGAIAYALLFSQLGIPTEALAIAIALDMITDFFVTSGKMFCMLPALVNVSSKIGMLDTDILRNE